MSRVAERVPGAAAAPDAGAAEVARAELRRALEAVAARFGGAARDTILLENGGKHLHELQAMLRALPPGGRILDVGGGLGVNLLVLKELRGAAVDATLVDRFVEYTAENRMGPAERGLDLMRRAGIALLNRDFWPQAALPLEAGAFDVITCFDVVEHLPGHPLALLREARRLLRPGGCLLLSGPNAVSLMKRLDLLLGRHPYMPFEAWVSEAYHSHFREYTRAEYVRLLELTGFRQVRSTLLAEPARTRALNRYHDGRHRPFSPTALALWALYLCKLALPPLRPNVFLAGTAGAAGAVGTEAEA